MFEVTTQNTFEEYKTYIRAAFAAHRSTETASFKRNRVIMLTISEAASLAYIVFMIWVYHETGFAFAIIMAGIVICFEIYGVYRIINWIKMFRTPKDEKFFRKLWENSVNTHGEEYTLTFDNECFSVFSPKFSANIKYELVNKLIETHTHFYIMSGFDYHGFIVCKFSLTKEQCMFIRTNCSSEEKPLIIA